VFVPAVRILSALLGPLVDPFIATQANTWSRVVS